MKLTNNFFQKTGKVFLYSSSVIFKNYKSYLYTVLLPLVVTLLMLLIKTNFFLAPTNNYTFPLLFIVPSMTLIIFFSTLLLDWRKSTFIKQMKNFGINKYSFVLGFTLTTFLCSLMASAFGIFYVFIFSFISPKRYNGFLNWAKFLTNGTQVLGVIISILLSSIFASFISILFTGYLRNIYVIQTVNVLLIVLFIAFSDILVSPGESARFKFLAILGYFDPYKYISWVTLMLNGKMNINFYYIYFFIEHIDGYVAFDQVWQPILGSIGFTLLAGTLATFLFSVSTKK